MTGRLLLHLAALMGGTVGAGWALAALVVPGLSFMQAAYCVAGAWAGVAAVLWSIAGIARMEP